MTLPDLAGLLRSLHDGRVRHVVIGGVALAAHGRLRATEDIDSVPDPDAENLRRLSNVLTALEARLTLDPGRPFGPSERMALERGRSMSLSTSQGELDIVQRLPGVPPYHDLDAAAIEDTLFDVPVRVSSREHLVAMKRARGSTQDLADLEALEAEHSA